MICRLNSIDVIQSRSQTVSYTHSTKIDIVLFVVLYFGLFARFIFLVCALSLPLCARSLHIFALVLEAWFSFSSDKSNSKFHVKRCARKRKCLRSVCACVRVSVLMFEALDLLLMCMQCFKNFSTCQLHYVNIDFIRLGFDRF